MEKKKKLQTKERIWNLPLILYILKKSLTKISIIFNFRISLYFIKNIPECVAKGSPFDTLAWELIPCYPDCPCQVLLIFIPVLFACHWYPQIPSSQIIFLKKYISFVIVDQNSPWINTILMIGFCSRIFIIRILF